MSLALRIEDLSSRVVRSGIGTRVLRATEGSQSDNNGILSFFLSGLGSLAGFIIGSVGGLLQFSWSTLWGLFVAAKQFIWNFNWNATDAQLDNQIRQKFNALAGQAGGALGNAFGYLACGIVPAQIIMAFNEPLGIYLLDNVKDEFIDEFTENFGALLRSILQLATQWFVAETYKSVRKLIKSNSGLIKRVFGSSAEKAIKAWGEKGSNTWSFASATEALLDKKLGEDTPLRNFAEEFLEEADEACVEAGYVIANAADTYFAQQMANRQVAPVLGETRYVEITPDRTVTTERIVLGGREEVLRNEIVQTLTTNRQFNGRDLGIIYGTPPAEIAERRHRPEVVLKFYQKQNKNSKKGEITEALLMQITFRLMNKTKDDFENDDFLKQLAQRIYSKFATPPFKVGKGTHTYTYADFEKGYQFKLDVISQTEARRVVEQVLDLQSHKVDDDLLRKGSEKAVNNNNTVPDKITVRGKRVEIKNQKKVGEVSFIYAYLNIGVNLPPINLVDLTGKKKDVVYKPKP